MRKRPPSSAARKCLYVVYWGATEPIGQAGTVPTVIHLAEREGEAVFLVTFDKPADASDRRLVSSLRERFSLAGVKWDDLRYTKHPANLSTAWDIVKGVTWCSYLVVRHRIPVVHGRTFVGGIIGSLVRSLVPGVRFVCHPDGFWPHERVDDGVWREGSRAHRLALNIERFMYHRADAIVVLSTRAREALRRDPALRTKPIHVIHTSVDVSRFELAAPRRPGEPMRIVYLGSLGGRYMSKDVFRLLALAHRRRGAHCTVATRATQHVASAFESSGTTADDIEVISLEPENVPGFLVTQHAGVFMLAAGRSNIATSATKVGEYLAAGLPVLLTSECGDLDQIVSTTGTGVVLRGLSDADLEEGLERLDVLTRDPETPSRCRRTAAQYMGLASVAAVQAEIHRAVLGDARQRPAELDGGEAADLRSEPE